MFIKCITFRQLAKHSTSGGKSVSFIDQNESQFQDRDDPKFETKKEKTK